MSRSVVLALLLAACNKSAAPQSDTGAKGTETTAGDMSKAPGMGDPKAAEGTSLTGAPAGAPMGGGGGASDPQRLQTKEGTLAVIAPSDAKAGSELEAMIQVTPGSGYHINKEFPTKIKFDKLDGVTFAKDQLTAGGADATKGDADTLDEQRLVFKVKMTPAAGNHTITGTFKFAVCDKDSCLPKKEAISIQVAAK